MINKWIGVGRLTAQPELRYSQSGVGIATFTLAVDRKRKDQNGEKKADFIRVKVIGAQAEPCANYLDKGKLAYVEGELHIETSEKDGQKRWFAEIVSERVVFLSPKQTDNFGGMVVDFSDDDIPF